MGREDWYRYNFGTNERDYVVDDEECEQAWAEKELKYGDRFEDDNGQRTIVNRSPQDDEEH